MRLSSNETDSGYRAFKAVNRHVRVVVRLDGQLLKECVMADTKRGCALIAETDAVGGIVLNRAKDQVKMRQMFGRVEIEFERRVP